MWLSLQNWLIIISVSVISATIPPLKHCTLTLCLFVVSSSSLTLDIIESPTIATVPFGYFPLEFCLLLLFSFFIWSFLGFYLFFHMLGDIFLYWLYITCLCKTMSLCWMLCWWSIFVATRCDCGILRLLVHFVSKCFPRFLFVFFFSW